MLKIAGAGLILVTAIILGLQMKQGLWEHVRQLIGLKEMLQMLSGEISYAKTPLTEAFRHVALRVKEPFCWLLVEVADSMEREREKTLYEIWEKAVKHQRRNISFSEEELAILSGVGENFGYLDIQMQLNHLALYIQQTEDKIVQAQQELAVKQKLYQSLSVMSGLLLILLFI